MSTFPPKLLSNILLVSAGLGLILAGLALAISLYYGYQFLILDKPELLDGVLYGLLFNLSATVCTVPIALLLGKMGKTRVKKYIDCTALAMCAIAIIWYCTLSFIVVN